MNNNRVFLKHFNQIKRNPSKNFQDITLDEADTTVLTGVLVVDRPPYNVRGMKVQVKIPATYPFTAPEVRFLTSMYHMSVTDEGLACIPALQAGNWKPCHNLNTLIESLVKVITNFEPEAPVRPEIAEQYSKDKEAFFETVRTHLLANGVPISTPLEEKTTDGENTNEEVATNGEEGPPAKRQRTEEEASDGCPEVDTNDGNPTEDTEEVSEGEEKGGQDVKTTDSSDQK